MSCFRKIVIRSSSPIRSETSEDALLGGRVRLRQPKRGYRVAVDPVLLAAAVPARTGARVLDAGAGVGAASLCLASRLPGVAIDGLELQSGLAALARENAAINGMESRFRVIEGDVADPPEALAEAYDHVMTNPPYLPAHHGHPPADDSKRIANRETTADLSAWLDFCLARVRPGGTVTLIHRADRLDEILTHIRGRLGGAVVFPLWLDEACRDTKRVVVSGVLGDTAPVTMCAGLVLHRADGGFTAEAQVILRDGAALRLADD
jgi:tRNA1(Val) A37 N6-methylase TrmN6